MPKLPSHEKYQLYKRCLESGVPEDIAVKIREYSSDTLHDLLDKRFFDTEIEDILYGAFLWGDTPEGFDFWSNTIDELTSKGEKV